MRRQMIFLAFFFISLSLFSQMLVSTGVASDLGLDARAGGDDAVDDVRSETGDTDTGAPTGSTLFGLYNVLSSQLASVLGVINPGLRMLYNVGVPAFLVGGPSTVGLLPPLATFVKFVGIVMFLRGL